MIRIRARLRITLLGPLKGDSYLSAWWVIRVDSIFLHLLLVLSGGVSFLAGGARVAREWRGVSGMVAQDIRRIFAATYLWRGTISPCNSKLDLKSGQKARTGRHSCNLLLLRGPS